MVESETKKESENKQENGSGGLEYDPLPDGTFAVSAVTTLNLSEIIIPETYKGKAVSAILPEAFQNATKLTSITIPSSVTSIDAPAFHYCSSLTTVYYGSTADDWARISIGNGNSHLTNATRYYYSETQPTTTGNYWHYVDGVPTKW